MQKISLDFTLSQFQSFINDVYGFTDDRLLSLPDLLANQNKYTMRTLKGIRKKDNKKIKHNLLISFSWCMSVAHRLHIDIEQIVWQRFPYVCLYCVGAPCVCKKIKPEKLAIIKPNNLEKPHTLQGFQGMFGKIYPAKSRKLSDAGIHMGEEMGELAESIHNYFGRHTKKRFTEVEYEIADYVSHIFGVANSIEINLVKELTKMFEKGCHDCHKFPCNCSFLDVIDYRS